MINLDFQKKKQRMLNMGYTFRKVTDCNEALSPGVYRGLDVKNSPTTGPIELLVTQNSDSWTIQEMSDVSMNTYLRSHNANAWSSWVRIYQELSGEELNIVEEFKKLHKRISDLDTKHSKILLEVSDRLNTIEGRELTGEDVLVTVRSIQKTLQRAILDTDFCLCEPEKPAICGTFDCGEVDCGQGLQGLDEKGDEV